MTSLPSIVVNRIGKYRWFALELVSITLRFILFKTVVRDLVLLFPYGFHESSGWSYFRFFYFAF